MAHSHKHVRGHAGQLRKVVKTMMSSKTGRWSEVFLAIVCACYASTVSAQQVNEQTSKHVTSEPLSSLALQTESKPATRHDAHPVRPLPRPKKGERKPVSDKAVQKKGPSAKLDVSVDGPFDGVGGALYSSPVDPSDTVGAVGRTQYVQWVNQAIAVFDKKTGIMVGKLADGSSLWKNLKKDLKPSICSIFNDGDPVVLYDRAADRWLLTQFAVSGGAPNNPSKPYAQCVAVSNTPDATGTYSLYEFDFENMNDYPKFGVWPDGYYATFNMFQHILPDPDDTNYKFLGARVCVLERAKMLAGEDARMKCFDVADVGGLLPADLDGGDAPPPGSPNYVLGLDLNKNQLDLWTFHVDWNDPTKTTLNGPTSIPGIADFNLPDDVVQQPKTKMLLQTLGDRLMFRLAYRNFSDHEALVATHTVALGASTGLRWYEIRSPGKTPIISQQGTYAPDTTFRWIGSIAMDKAGDILLGYSASSSKVFPAIRITGRAVNDPLGVMRAEQTVTAGERQQPGSNRWGDYASISVDPDDDCSFYFGSEYLQAAPQLSWSTKFVRVRFNSCK